jgi:NADH-quinone oxidoreductase subunit C
MSNEEIKNFITNNNPSVTIDETGEFLNVEVSIAEFRQLAKDLFGQGFQYLFCVTCIDWKTHLTMVYHMSSPADRNSIVLKVKLDRGNPEIETVSDIWRTAEFHEREVYEMFGVIFQGHPDLRRLILTDDFVGFPLRKDFDDPVNMIKL